MTRESSALLLLACALACHHRGVSSDRKTPQVEYESTSEASSTPLDSLALPSAWRVGERNIYDLMPRSQSIGPSLIAVERPPRITNPPPPSSADYAVSRTCGPDWCIDTLRDTKTGTELLPGSPDQDVRAVLRGGDGPGSYYRRTFKVMRQSEIGMSLLVGEAWYTAGAAHSNAALECRTLDSLGKRKSLEQVLPNSRRMLAWANSLRDSETALETIGAPLIKDSCGGCRFSADNFLVDGADRVLLCLGTDSPGAFMGAVHIIDLAALRQAQRKLRAHEKRLESSN